MSEKSLILAAALAIGCVGVSVPDTDASQDASQDAGADASAELEPGRWDCACDVYCIDPTGTLPECVIGHCDYPTCVQESGEVIKRTNCLVLVNAVAYFYYGLPLCVAGRVDCDCELIGACEMPPETTEFWVDIVAGCGD